MNDTVFQKVKDQMVIRLSLYGQSTRLNVMVITLTVFFFSVFIAIVSTDEQSEAYNDHPHITPASAFTSE